MSGPRDRARHPAARSPGGHDKDYDATIRLGQRTVTDDAEGEIEAAASTASIGIDQVLAKIPNFLGEIQQVPSKVSAIKVDGERSYKRVRDGEDVELPPRAVTVSAFDVLAHRRPTADLLDVDVFVACSSGTYIRAIARDLGQELGVGGHLTRLRRTRVGGFTWSKPRHWPSSRPRSRCCRWRRPWTVVPPPRRR